MQLPKPSSKKVAVSGLKIGKKPEKTEAIAPLPTSLRDMFAERMMDDLDRLGDAAGITSSMRPVRLVYGLTVEVYRPTLKLARRADSFSLQESLVRICKGAYPTLMNALSSTRMISTYIGGELPDTPVELRVAIMMATAKRLFEAQEWTYVAECSSWQAPAYIGDGFLVTEEELRDTFREFVTKKLREMKLLK